MIKIALFLLFVITIFAIVFRRNVKIWWRGFKMSISSDSPKSSSAIKNSGKDLSVKNCEFKGYETILDDEGEGTTFEGNKAEK